MIGLISIHVEGNVREDACDHVFAVVGSGTTEGGRGGVGALLVGSVRLK